VIFKPPHSINIMRSAPVLIVLLLLSLTANIEAKSWRGITPLRSTKIDVVWLLGEPTEASDKLLTYRFPTETVFISLITVDTPSANLKILKPGTVDDIQVMPKETVYVADLGLDEKRLIFTKGSKPEYAGFEGYVDEDAGLIVKTSGKRIEIIFYFASAKDRARCPRCAVDPQSIADMLRCALCPPITVSCPEQVEPGDKVGFTAAFTIGTPIKETYNWTVDEGTIIAGQGTPSITVDVSKSQGKTITGTVEIGGIDAACPKTASCSTKIP
jgi:hypothetical protein